MPYRDELYDLEVQIHSRHHDLAAGERASLEACLGSLAKLVSRFPGASLHVDIARHPRAKDFHVKTSLRLAGRTLFTGERDPLLHHAYERCVRKLMHKAKAYREKLERKPTIEKEVQGRPRDRAGNWFESLIDPSLRALLEHPDAEKENLGYVRETTSGVD